MAKLSNRLDLSVIAELSRPNGKRRVFTLFQQRQGTCAIGAPASYALLRGITGLHDSARRAQLQAFCCEPLLSGPTVLPFDQGASVWPARSDIEQARKPRNWTVLDGTTASYAPSNDMTMDTCGRTAERLVGKECVIT